MFLSLNCSCGPFPKELSERGVSWCQASRGSCSVFRRKSLQSQTPKVKLPSGIYSSVVLIIVGLEYVCVCVFSEEVWH